MNAATFSDPVVHRVGTIRVVQYVNVKLDVHRPRFHRLRLPHRKCLLQRQPQLHFNK